MKITFDPQVDAMYIRFIDDPAQVTTQRLSEDVAINFAPDGRVVGIEILDATEYIFRSKKERKIVVQNLTAVAARPLAERASVLTKGDFHAALWTI